MKVLDIYNFIDSIAPFDSQMDFDNSGMLVGNFDSNVNKVLISLDVTKEVIYECKKINSNLIISHHPVIFHPIKKLYHEDIPYILSQNQISVICAHTNMDLSPIGVNFCLFNSLGLKDKSPLSFYKEYELGYCGFLENEMSSLEFASFVKQSLKCDNLRFTQISNKIKKVAVCSGAGGSLINEVYSKKCDAFVTGEIKHSDIVFANEHNISIFDVGHFKSENLIVSHLKNILQKEFSTIQFFESSVFTDKIQFL